MFKTFFSSPFFGGAARAFTSAFLAPIQKLVAGAQHQRSCPSISDNDFIALCVRRVLEHNVSGREFLQQLTLQGMPAPETSVFFESLKSARRLALIKEITNASAAMLPTRDVAAWAHIPELSDFDLYVGDGHFHAAAAHDVRHGKEEKKYAVPHFFRLNLRTNALSYLTLGDQVTKRKEHDMHALKRLDIEALRQGTPKGKKVLYVWDRAGIDFFQWHKWKQKAGIYFLSREKLNMNLTVIGVNPFEASDPRNEGVVSDEIVATSQHVSVRRVKYICPLNGESFSFLTNENHMPPGVVALLYRLRWEIEKTFDELKSKLHEGKAWATSENAKEIQGHALCLTHNLMIQCENLLEEQGVMNKAEIKRRKERLEEAEEKLAKVGKSVPFLTKLFQRLTVRSVKFIRWLRVQLFLSSHNEADINGLRRLYEWL